MNLQNIPRDAVIKNLFVAPPGYVLVELDYSQAELRVLAYYSGDPWLKQVYLEDRDLHDAVATEIFGLNFTKEQRHIAKCFNFGIAYGRGAASIAEELNISTTMAKAAQAKWFEPMPLVKEYLDAAKKTAIDGEPLETVLGRRRHFILNDKNFWAVQNEAMNFRIQSTASDITAMCVCAIQHKIFDEELVPGYLINNVHDSIIAVIPEERKYIDAYIDEATHFMEFMPTIVLPGLDIPFKADAKIGAKWGCMQKWK